MRLIHKVVYPLITALIIFLLMQPYFVWGKSLLYLNYLLYLIVLCNFRVKDIKELVYFFIFVLIFAIPPIVQGNNLFGLLNCVMVVLLFFTRKDYIEQSYRYFTIIMSATMAISILMWILISIGIPIPGEMIEPLNDVKLTQYMAFPFLVVKMDIDDMISMLRFGGMFDEPGVVGTINFLMLVINKFNLKKWYNIILLIGGILSMSLFFYIGVAVYIILTYIIDTQRPILRRISVLILLIACGVALVKIPATSELIVGRLEFDSTTNTIKGDNRSDVYLSSYIESIKGTPEYYWGVNNKAIVESFAENAGYRNAILLYGAVFMILYIAMFGVYGYQYSNNIWRWCIMMVVMLITLYQRPGFMHKEYIFLFICLFRINDYNKLSHEL